MTDHRAANLDAETVTDFGREWKRFDQSSLDPAELAQMFDDYFAIFPWDSLPANAQGFDAGCGSGRWAALVAPRVGRLHCVDASAEALAVARNRLAGTNVELHHAPVNAMPFAEGSMDFGYSLGVLHHIPNTQEGLAACVSKLKPGAPFLVYLYYDFDNRPAWFRTIWRVSERVRRLVAPAPFRIKSLITDAIAVTVYWPLARFALLVEALGGNGDALPLGAYRHRTLYVMRNDALDRFGTRLEQRFTKAQIEAMMRAAGLGHIRFSPNTPYWCAVGRRMPSDDSAT